jgi:hypothetical protein
MNAILIETGGTAHGVVGDVRSSEWIREQVGCEWFQVLYLDDGIIAWLDEEGRLKRHAPTNMVASVVVHQLGQQVGPIVGNVLFTGMKGEDTADLTPAQVTRIEDIAVRAVAEFFNR